MKRRRNRAGFTLPEMLVVCAVLALVSAAAAGSIGGLLAGRRTMWEAAEADLLAARAGQILTEELRFGQRIRLAGDRVILDSARWGPDTELALGADGQLMAGGRVVPGVGAPGGLRLTDLTLALGANGEVWIALSVRGGERILWQNTFSVRPLNGVETTAQDSADAPHP